MCWENLKARAFNGNMFFTMNFFHAESTNHINYFIYSIFIIKLCYWKNFFKIFFFYLNLNVYFRIFVTSNSVLNFTQFISQKEKKRIGHITNVVDAYFLAKKLI